MNMNPSTELGKAIELLDSGQWALTPFPIQEAALLVAKRLKEVEKERNEYRSYLYGCDKHKLWKGSWCIGCLEQELLILRTEYEKALKALSELVNNLCSCHFKGECSACKQLERKHEVLSTPLAIEVMKDGV